MLLNAIIRTIRTLLSGYFITLLIKSALLSFIAFLLFLGTVKMGLNSTEFVSIGWIEWILDYIVNIGAGFIAWLLLPTMLPLIGSLFQEHIAKKIEKKEYPNITLPSAKPLLPELLYELKFFGWSLLLNLICLPFYLIPLVNIPLYYGLNGYLIGREFFEMVGGRHLGKPTVKLLRKSNRLPVFLAGILLVIITNIPFANLLAPFLAIAVMVHLYHRINPL